GVETFDMAFRENVLIKGIDEPKPEKIAREFYEVCLLFGIAGQTEESMRFDIETGLKYFERVCVNIMVENGTRIKPSPEVTDIFRNKIYADYIDNDRVDILMENTDFGVG
ncbi:MAG: radical SAM protein, partial [Butyrivibrio sp.]